MSLRNALTIGLVLVWLPGVPAHADTETEGAPPDTSKAKAAPTIVVYERPEDEMTPEEIERIIWAEPKAMHPILTRIDEEGKAISLDFVPSYDRVDEVGLRFHQTFEHRKKRHPVLRLQEVYSTGRERFNYRVEFEQPLLAESRSVLGAALYDETAPFSDLANRVSNTENTLAALLFREDFRHYYAREGFTLFGSHGIPRGPRITLAYTDEIDGALEASTNGSLFRPRDGFRDNPQARGGRLRSWEFGLTYDSPQRTHAPALEQHHQLAYEIAGGRTGGAFSFERWVCQLRIRLRLAPDQEMIVRLKGGGRRAGELPLQRWFYLGGIGTLRAHTFGGIQGDTMYLINVEYGFDVFGGIQAVVFQDVGTAWSDPARLAETRPELDTGIALRKRSGRFRINVARDLRRDPSPVVTVRIAQPF